MFQSGSVSMAYLACGCCLQAIDSKPSWRQTKPGFPVQMEQIVINTCKTNTAITTYQKPLSVVHHINTDVLSQLNVIILVHIYLTFIYIHLHTYTRAEEDLQCFLSLLRNSSSGLFQNPGFLQQLQPTGYSTDAGTPHAFPLTSGPVPTPVLETALQDVRQSQNNIILT